MSNKFNANALSEYSKSYARRIATDFYQQHATIDGSQILSLTPIQQINLLIISSLSDKWKADAEKFRSPYFDFAHADVQEALQNFMNVVSQHISVRREHLEPFLAEATRKTIILIFDPRAYFDEIIRGQPDYVLTAGALKQISRFTKINQFIPAHITQRTKDKPFVYINQAIGFLEEALSQRGHEMEHYDQYVALFSEKLPMDVASLLRSHVPDNIPNAPARSFFDAVSEPSTPPAPLVPVSDTSNAPMISPLPEPIESVETPNVEVSEPVEEVVDMQKTESEQPVATSVNEMPIVLPETIENESVAPVAEPEQPKQEPAPKAKTPTESPVTLNDTLRETKSSESGSTVAETFHRAPIESVARSISLNQKFRFINQLFNGNAIAYNQAVEEIDTLPTYGQALELISEQYALQYLWDMKSDEVTELIEILKRRFEK